MFFGEVEAEGRKGHTNASAGDAARIRGRLTAAAFTCSTFFCAEQTPAQEKQTIDDT